MQEKKFRKKARKFKKFRVHFLGGLLIQNIVLKHLHVLLAVGYLSLAEWIDLCTCTQGLLCTVQQGSASQKLAEDCTCGPMQYKYPPYKKIS